MKRIKTAEYCLHSGQVKIWKTLNGETPPKITVIAAGARWGKDRFCLLALLALSQKWRIIEEERRKKEGLIPPVLCWYVAPTFSLLRQSWDELKFIAAQNRDIKLNNSELRAFLPGGIQIEFKSADNPGSLLGRGLDIVVCTEAARMKKEAWENSILTRLSSPGRGPNGTGGIAILNSTPNGQNWFYDLWTRAKGDQEKHGANSYMQAYRFTSYDSPLANIEELNAHRQILPSAAFAQEYLAEFIPAGGSVFRKLANSIVKYKYPETRPDRGSLIYTGIDWGRHNDRTAIAVILKYSDKIRLINFKLLKNCEYNAQLNTIKYFAELYPSAEIVPECNSLGDPLIAQLRGIVKNRISPFFTSHQSKLNLIETVIANFERGEIELPAEDTQNPVKCAVPELFDELARYEIQQTRGGAVTFNAPTGQHDDAVIAFCLAAAGKQSGRGRLVGVK